MPEDLNIVIPEIIAFGAVLGTLAYAIVHAAKHPGRYRTNHANPAAKIPEKSKGVAQQLGKNRIKQTRLGINRGHMHKRALHGNKLR